MSAQEQEDGDATGSVLREGSAYSTADSKSAAELAKRPWLRPWQPGQSGNPHGRPSEATLKQRIRKGTADGQELVDVVLQVLRDESGGIMGRKLRLEAATWLRDTGWGRPLPILPEPDDPEQDGMSLRIREVVILQPAPRGTGDRALPPLEREDEDGGGGGELPTVIDGDTVAPATC